MAIFIQLRGGEYGPSGGSPQFWRNMRMWTFIIDEIFNDREPDFDSAMTVKEEPNRSIAYVNIKKNVEEKKEDKNSDDYDIVLHASKDKNFLKKQINIIKPDIVLCGGTFKYCPYIWQDNEEIESFSEKIFKIENKWFISFSHTSVRGSYESSANELIAIVKELKTIIENQRKWEDGSPVCIGDAVVHNSRPDIGAGVLTNIFFNGKVTAEFPKHKEKTDQHNRLHVFTEIPHTSLCKI